ncbi:methyl-galactoside transport system permease protein [Cupriavidus basilensis OR16]|uniref:Methyl-galactoside transport system permease protein n=1 Tax=Cupriavidus basilensis OR16 TaxID=1127483 RepID=H1SH14_9BURK|nr:methyl-galactoside transport system permease protein [Cupriavidus basilensis OR16]
MMGAISPGFATSDNLANIVSQSAVLLLLALGQMLVVVTRGFDISVGAVAVLSSIVIAQTAAQFGEVVRRSAGHPAGHGRRAGGGALQWLPDRVPPHGAHRRHAGRHADGTRGVDHCQRWRRRGAAAAGHDDPVAGLRRMARCAGDGVAGRAGGGAGLAAVHAPAVRPLVLHDRQPSRCGFAGRGARAHRWRAGLWTVRHAGRAGSGVPAGAQRCRGGGRRRRHGAAGHCRLRDRRRGAQRRQGRRVAGHGGHAVHPGLAQRAEPARHLALCLRDRTRCGHRIRGLARIPDAQGGIAPGLNSYLHRNDIEQELES